MALVQLPLPLQDWPTPGVDGVYESDSAQCLAFVEHDRSGGARIEIMVLEIFDSVYALGYTFQCGEHLSRQPLSVKPSIHFSRPEDALIQGLGKARRFLRTNHVHVSVAVAKNALSWVEEQLVYYRQLVERQQRLFER